MGQVTLSREKLEELTEEMARRGARSAAMANALEAVLLFHSSSPWDEDKERAWEVFTGTTEATTRNLCDTARKALGRPVP